MNQNANPIFIQVFIQLFPILFHDWRYIEFKGLRSFMLFWLWIFDSIIITSACINILGGIHWTVYWPYIASVSTNQKRGTDLFRRDPASPSSALYPHHYNWTNRKVQLRNRKSPFFVYKNREQMGTHRTSGSAQCFCYLFQENFVNGPFVVRWMLPRTLGVRVHWPPIRIHFIDCFHE